MEGKRTPTPRWYKSYHISVERLKEQPVTIYHANRKFGSMLAEYFANTPQYKDKVVADSRIIGKNGYYGRSELYEYLLSTRSPGRLYILYNEIIDDYDIMAMKIATKINVRLIFISPNPVPYTISNAFDMRQGWNYQTDFVNLDLVPAQGADRDALADHIMSTKQKGNILVITQSPDISMKVLNNIREINRGNSSIFLADEYSLHQDDRSKEKERTKESPVIIVSDRITDKIMMTKFVKIYIYPGVYYEEDLAMTMSPRIWRYRSRTMRELYGYTDLLAEGGVGYYLSKSEPTDEEIAPFQTKNAINATMLAIFHNKINAKLDFRIRDLKILMEFDIINKFNNLTNIGQAVVKYSDDLFAGLFVRLWILSHPENKMLYPALVIAAFIEEMPTFSTPISTISTFHEYMIFWEAVVKSNLLFGDANILDKWIIEQGWGSTLASFKRIIASLRYKMRHFSSQPVPFTALGAVTRSIPIFTKLFAQNLSVGRIEGDPHIFKSSRGDQTYKTTKYVDLPEELSFALLRYVDRGEEPGILRVVFPIERIEPVEMEDVVFEDLNPNNFARYTVAKPRDLQVVAIPAKILVNKAFL